MSSVTQGQKNKPKKPNRLPVNLSATVLALVVIIAGIYLAWQAMQTITYGTPPPAGIPYQLWPKRAAMPGIAMFYWLGFIAAGLQLIYSLTRQIWIAVAATRAEGVSASWGWGFFGLSLALFSATLGWLLLVGGLVTRSGSPQFQLFVSGFALGLLIVPMQWIGLSSHSTSSLLLSLQSVLLAVPACIWFYGAIRTAFFGGPILLGIHQAIWPTTVYTTEEIIRSAATIGLSVLSMLLMLITSVILPAIEMILFRKKYKDELAALAITGWTYTVMLPIISIVLAISTHTGNKILPDLLMGLPLLGASLGALGGLTKSEDIASLPVLIDIPQIKQPPQQQAQTSQNPQSNKQSIWDQKRLEQQNNQKPPQEKPNPAKTESEQSEAERIWKQWDEMLKKGSNQFSGFTKYGRQKIQQTPRAKKGWDELRRRFGDALIADLQSYFVEPYALTNIVGEDEAIKEALKALGAMLMSPQTRQRYGIKKPNGLLFYGEPGTGKTATAKALARSLGIAFARYDVSEIISKWMGASEKNMHAVFEAARNAAPTLLFFDEFDAIAGKRDGADLNRPSDRLLNTLLNEMGDRDDTTPVLVIAATNRIEDLDPAVLRDGRLGTHVYFGLPDEKARVMLFRKLLQERPHLLSKDHFTRLAALSEGLSQASIAQAVDEAALTAARQQGGITFNMLKDALDKRVKEIQRNQRNRFNGRKYKPDPHAFDRLLGIDPAIDELKRAIGDVLAQYNKQKKTVTTANDELEEAQNSAGILLYGPPGTGKTSLARAAAKYYGCWFYPVSVQQLVGGYAGQPERKLHSLFEEARAHAPAILFFDELDAIGFERDNANLNRASDILLPALQTELDGFDRNNGMVVLAATNRIDRIDPSLLRGGRFGRHIEVGLPDKAQRQKLLGQLLGVTQGFEEDTRLQMLARVSEGLAPGDLEDAVAAARQQARQENKPLTTQLLRSQLQARSMQKLSRDPAVIRFNARRFEPDEHAFDSLVGVDAAARALKQATRFALNIKPGQESDPALAGMNGILLYGPPGVGKTALARATAQYFGCWFFAAGPQNLRSREDVHELFDQARLKAPAIVFLDEVDALAGARQSADYTLVQSLLVELNGIDPLSRIVVIAATNLPQSLDPALLRGGRLGRHIEIGLPDAAARKQLLEQQLINRAAPSAVTQEEIDELAAITQDYSPADIVAAINQAVRDCVEEGKAITKAQLVQLLQQ